MSISRRPDRLVNNAAAGRRSPSVSDFLTAIFPDSRIKNVTALPSESASRPRGSVKVVEFELFGQPFVAMSAGLLDRFNHAVSSVVNCDDQAEIDRYWNALLEGVRRGVRLVEGSFGLSDRAHDPRQLMSDPDRTKAKRAADAMMKMVKFDIAPLQAAFDFGSCSESARCEWRIHTQAGIGV